LIGGSEWPSGSPLGNPKVGKLTKAGSFLMNCGRCLIVLLILLWCREPLTAAVKRKVFAANMPLKERTKIFYSRNEEKIGYWRLRA
jgi:hypothetical protein